MRARLPWGLEGRHVLAALLGGALLVLPLYIMSYDPDAKLERLRAPLCRGGLVVEATNQEGGDELLTPDSGLKVRALVDGEALHATLRLFTRDPGGDWKFSWELDAPTGREIYYLPNTPPGFGAYVRALDPAGRYCPADSPTLVAPAKG